MEIQKRIPKSAFRKGRRKTGGRKKGTPNRVTLAKAAEIAKSGITPLDYMLKVMRDKKGDPYRRDEMARAAAPYVHPKLASVEHFAGTEGMPMVPVLNITVSGGGPKS